MIRINYSNRNGRDIQSKDLIEALEKQYGIDPSLASFLTNSASPNGSLDLFSLQKHGFIEHDVSLVHEDVHLGNNSVPVLEFVNELMKLSDKYPKLNREALAIHHKNRLAYELKRDSNITFGTKEKLTAYSEASLLLLSLGGKSKEVEWEVAFDFLYNERLNSKFIPRTDDLIGWGRVTGEVALFKLELLK